MRKLLIDANGIVVNSIVADDSFTAPAGLSICPSSDGDIGMRWDGNAFIDERIHPEAVAVPYYTLRAAEYPSIGDQLDALFHAGVFPPEMAAIIQAVKDKYPKP